MLFVIVATSVKFLGPQKEGAPDLAKIIRSSLPILVAFFALIGISWLVSHGTIYAKMAVNYWDMSPLDSTSRRLALPALSHALGIGAQGFTIVWYLTFSVALCLAVAYAGRQGLHKLEIVSVLSSSIFAYLLIGPGYSEVLVFLVGFWSLLARQSFSEKFIAAALMIAAHEIAALFALLALIIDTEGEDRRHWFLALVILYGVYALSYALSFRTDLLTHVVEATKPGAGASTSSLGHLLQAPKTGLLAIAIAYKAYWVAVPICFSRCEPRKRLAALLVLCSVPLILIGTDASRLVQFSSLAFFLVVTDLLPRLSDGARRWLAAVNLLIPSVYIATNSQPLWGTGAYSLYLRAARSLGFNLGQIWLP